MATSSHPGTARMEANGMDLHESQSRFWIANWILLLIIKTEVHSEHQGGIEYWSEVGKVSKHESFKVKFSKLMFLLFTSNSNNLK